MAQHVIDTRKRDALEAYLTLCGEFHAALPLLTERQRVAWDHRLEAAYDAALAAGCDSRNVHAAYARRFGGAQPNR